MKNNVVVIGGGLAGSEACYQLAKRGVNVTLYDIKPHKFTPAHSNKNFAELVCSNSLKSLDITTSSGLLKQELELFDSLIIKAAKQASVPAGNALAVDREKFSQIITDTLKSYKNITIISQEITSLPQGENVIVATGPLTTEDLCKNLGVELNLEYLHFFDASSPIITKDSIDLTKCFVGDRYGKGDGDYINCPLNKQEYENFVTQLIGAKRVILKGFEGKEVFEGCMPIEVMASRGQNTLRFGPLKPVGLADENGNKPYACVQLRKEDNYEHLYNLVGFQTNLTFTEQKRVFSLIPALNNAEYIRYGVMHRNTYICAPVVINKYFQVKNNPNVFIAGQLSGVEGYIESTMSGLISAINMYNTINKKSLLNLSANTMIGAIINYITSANAKNFQPMNCNYGILNKLEEKEKDEKIKKQKLAKRALLEIEQIVKNI